MTINFLIKRRQSSSGHANSYARIYVRLRDGREVDQSVRTRFIVEYRMWNSRRGEFSPCGAEENFDWQKMNRMLEELRNSIARKYIEDCISHGIGPDWLRDTVAELSGEGERYTLSSTFGGFLKSRQLSDERRMQYEVVMRLVVRFVYWEKHIARNRCSARRPDESHHGGAVEYGALAEKINISYFNPAVLTRLWDFSKNENVIFSKSAEMRAAFPEKKVMRRRGNNTMNEIFKKLRAVFHWCVESGIVDRNPFDNFKISADLYGTPIYITIEELHHLHSADLSKWPRLQRQKDIFVFQCNVGCRIGDLRRFTGSNLVNGSLEYIPSKTVAKNPRTVTIPLNDMAREILSKYPSLPDDRLLPCTSTQKYNMAIKEIFEIVGLDRKVTVLDPVTQKEKRVCLYEIASSHMARRTFAGNIYKNVKDPNLVASLTGHCDGSRAFSRYRAIDDDIKKELVGMLE